MFLARYGIASLSALCVLTSTSAFAANECASMTLKKRVACLEQKIDKMAASAVTPQSVQQTIASWMDGVKIEYKKRPGLCMWAADDWNNNPDTPKEFVRTALGCETEGYIFKVRK